ncbi:MAG: hypothetical protein CMJ46_16150 [Planctomyces sp.]|nr:hypothetical protein [Planctomyces sp.]
MSKDADPPPSKDVPPSEDSSADAVTGEESNRKGGGDWKSFFSALIRPLSVIVAMFIIAQIAYSVYRYNTTETILGDSIRTHHEFSEKFEEFEHAIAAAEIDTESTAWKNILEKYHVLKPFQERHAESVLHLSIIKTALLSSITFGAIMTSLLLIVGFAFLLYGFMAESSRSTAISFDQGARWLDRVVFENSNRDDARRSATSGKRDSSKPGLNTDNAADKQTSVRNDLMKQAAGDVGAHLSFLMNQITSEKEDTKTRAKVNISLGFVVSATGMICLIVLMFLSNSEPSEVERVSTYLTRGSFIVFTQVFGFFFLRMYKASLDEIKYFQNEITNLAMQYTALTIAEETGDSEILHDVIMVFAEAERNFKLRSGESTVDLERAKQNDAAILEYLKLTKPAAR